MEKYKGKKLSELVECISKDFVKPVDVNILKEYIANISDINKDKSNKTNIIFSLATALEENDEDAILDYSIELKCLEIDQLRNKFNQINNESTRQRDIEENKSEKLQSTINIMTKVINGEDLSEDEVINNEFNSYVRKNVKNFDTDFYLDYVIKLNSLESIDSIDMDHYIKTISCFVKSLQERLDKLVSLDHRIPEDFEEMEKIYVDNLEDYGSDYLSRPGNVFKVKFNRITSLLNEYRLLLDTFTKIRDTRDFSHIEAIKNQDKKNVQSDSYYIRYFYDNVNNINNTKKLYIDKLVVGPSKLGTFKTDFVKKLIIDKKVEEKTC